MAHRHQELLRLYRQVRVQLRPPDLVKAQGAQLRVRRPPLDSQLQRQTVVVLDLDRLARRIWLITRQKSWFRRINTH